MGEAHSCARTSAGRVACWGDNEDHQIAASDEPQFETPRWQAEVREAASVQCGASETCVRTRQGSVLCWGGTRGVEALALPTPAVDLQLHRAGGCAVLSSGQVMCWSRLPRSGRFARAASEGSMPRALWPVPQLSGARSFLAAPPLADVVCAERSSGTACVRELSQPEAVSAAPVPAQGSSASEPASSLLASAPAQAEQRSVGLDHACAVVAGQALCWGKASQGQLGSGTRYIHAEALAVPQLDDATFLDASPLLACAVRSKGAVACWGALPLEGAASELAFEPRALSFSQPAEQVRAARPGPPSTLREHDREPTCLRSGSGWSCWDGKQFVRERRVEVSPLDHWKVKVAHYSPDRACGVSSEGTLVCAGGASAASSNRSMRTALVRLSGPEPFVQATSLFAVGGQEHVCGRSARGKVSCFVVSTASDVPPVAAPGLSALGDVSDVQAGSFGGDGAACALARSGIVSCWGDGRLGQVAVTAGRSPWDPAVVPQLPPAAQLAVGGSFACARVQAGAVYCWGDDRRGNAPNGELGTRAEALRVALPHE